MDWIRSASGPVVPALIGLTVLVAGLSDSVAAGPVKLEASSSTPLRLALVAVGLAICGVAARMAGRDKMQGVQDQGLMLSSLDELPGLEQELANATRISILSRTGINVLSSYERAFATTTAAGCEIRFILVDPDSPATEGLYGNNDEMYDHNLHTVLAKVSALKSRIGDRFVVKQTSHAPPFSMTVVEYGDKPGAARIQLNFLHTRVGRDRPTLRLTDDHEWFFPFLDEFDAIWNDQRGTSMLPTSAVE